MRRPLLLVAVLLLAGCGTAPSSSRWTIARAAEPQRAELDWRESYPSSGQRLLFAVDSLEVTRKGWSADIAVTNATTIPFDARRRPGTDSSFGLMLFANDNLDELKAAAEQRPAACASPGDPVRPSSARRARTEPDVAHDHLRPGLARRRRLRPRLVRAARAKGDPPEGMRRRGLDHGPVVPALTAETL